MKSIVRWSVGLLIVAAVASGATAFADDPLAKPKDATARERLVQGNKHYHVHELEQAIEDYKAGALAEDAPVFHYNLGQCYRQLGNYQEAIWHYERFLARVDLKSDVAVSVQEFVTQMKAELDKKAMSQPPTEPAADAAKPAPVEPPKPVMTPTPTPTLPPVPPTPREQRWYDDSLGWVATGVGAVGLGLGSYLIVDAHRISSDADNEPTQSTRDAMRDKASSRQLVGVISTLGGAAVLASGVVRFALSSSRTTTTTAWHLSFTPQGVQVSGGF